MKWEWTLSRGGKAETQERISSLLLWTPSHFPRKSSHLGFPLASMLNSRLKSGNLKSACKRKCLKYIGSRQRKSFGDCFPSCRGCLEISNSFMAERTLPLFADYLTRVNEMSEWCLSSTATLCPAFYLISSGYFHNSSKDSKSKFFHMEKSYFITHLQLLQF